MREFPANPTIMMTIYPGKRTKSRVDNFMSGKTSKTYNCRNAFAIKNSKPGLCYYSQLGLKKLPIFFGLSEYLLFNAAVYPQELEDNCCRLPLFDNLFTLMRFRQNREDLALRLFAFQPKNCHRCPMRIDVLKET